MELGRGEEILSFNGPLHGTKKISVDGTGQRVAVLGEDGLLLIYDLARRAPVHEFQARPRELAAMEDLVLMSRDGQLLMHQAGHHSLVVRQVGSSHVLRTLAARGVLNGPGCSAVTPDLRLGLIAAGEHTVVWDAQTGARLHVLTNRTSFVTAAALTPGGRQSVIGEDDDALTVWDLRTGQVQHVLEGHTDHVHTIRIGAGGRYAVSAAKSTLGVGPNVAGDRSVKVWDLEGGGAPVASFSGDSEVTAFDVTPGRVIVVAGEQSGRVHVLQLDGPTASDGNV
jgi:WD40 repeat protein